MGVGGRPEGRVVKSWIIISWLVVVFVMITGCVKPSRRVTECVTERERADLSEEAEAWADSVCRSMTLEEQLGQMVMPAVFSTTDPATMASVKWYAEELHTGGLLLLKGTTAAVSEIADTLEAIHQRHGASGAVMFIAIDAETGLGMRLTDAASYPWPSEIDRTADEQDFYDYGQEVGREARSAGINMILGPVVDVSRLEMPGGGVMKRRSLGSDQLRVSDLTLAYSRGLESQGVASVPKHFPGHGSTSTDSHEGIATLTITEDELYAIDLMPFRKAVKNGIGCIMVGHIWAAALDSVKRPASYSPIIIQHLLREEMGFDGLVLTDAAGMGGAEGYEGTDAILAGADIIIAPANTERELKRLKQAVDEGRLSRERVEESCRRILLRKYLLSRR